MFLSYITLAVALSLSVIAAYYSIAGLTAIFAAAVIPIIIMGSVLELGKVVVTLWLHEYWQRCRLLMKTYLVAAVTVLMLITSMGIFGFLSKAHSDQGLVSGDVQAKIAVYDEKIRTAKDNIDANRKAFKQLDESVDQVMGRSSTETGADKAVALRRAQSKERARLTAEIAAEQKTISKLNEEAAPIRAEVRKVEAEVGPIKYIAALVYGDNTDATSLEAAVRWVIIMLVIVFDPLAIMMLLAATESLKWEKQRLLDLLKLPEPEPNQQQRTDELLDIFKDQPTDLDSEPVPEQDTMQQVKSVDSDPHPPGWMFKRFDQPVHNPVAVLQSIPDNVDAEDENEKASIRAWKTSNPDDTIKRQRQLYEDGRIDHLPWDSIGLEVDNNLPQAQMRGFGIDWPNAPIKGDVFLRVDRLPSALFKYNGTKWIEIDKNLSDQYSYNSAYINHLISKIDSGEYDPDLLTDAEAEQIQQHLGNQQS
jgi:hypothetical protein